MEPRPDISENIFGDGALSEDVLRVLWAGVTQGTSLVVLIDFRW
jgi:hypothetical protein